MKHVQRVHLIGPALVAVLAFAPAHAQKMKTDIPADITVDLAARRLTVDRSDWLGHVTVPKGGRSRQLPMTQRLTAALKAARHLRSDRVLCLPDGAPITRDRAIKAVGGAQRVAGIEQGVHILRRTFCSHLAMKGAPARAIQELTGPVHDAALHAPESSSNGRRDPIA